MPPGGGLGGGGPGGGGKRPPREERPYTDRELLGRYLELVRPYRLHLFLVVCCYFLNAVLNLVPAASLYVLIDVFVAGKNASLFGFQIDGSVFADPADQTSGVVWFAASVVVVIVLANMVGVVMWRYGTRVTQRFLLDLKRRVHFHLHKLHVSYFEKERTGAIMSRCVSDVEQMDQMIRQSFSIFYGCVHLVTVPILMLGMSPLLFLFVLPPIPVMIFAVYRIRRHLRPLYKKMREQQAEIGAAIQEQISGIKEIKAFGQERPARRTYTRANIALVRTVHDTMRIFSVNHQVLYGNRDVAMLLVAVGGGLMVINDMGGVTIGMVLTFIPLLTRFLDPIQQLIGFYDVIQRGLASTERVFEFLDIEPEVDDQDGAYEVALTSGRVAFEQVRFAYEPGTDVLEDVSFTVEPGTKVAIVGSTGAGKTTMVSLLMRFYQPQQGRITIDGHDIAGLRYNSLSEAFGIVFQETFLFYGTIAQNIAFSRLDASQEQIEDAARRAQIHDFIADLPDGYETMCGERGVKLSGGQRQRLAIARMILKNPSVVILDEATSAVDNQTERAIQESLDELLHERTAFIIAHRLSTIQNADLVLCMDKGRLVEMGSPADLAARSDGVYAKLLKAGLSA